jgi:N-acetylglucosaminylphosphatidylinositol deacetylase
LSIPLWGVPLGALVSVSPSIEVLGGRHQADLMGICFQQGNNYGLGETRKQELQGSCRALGIHASRCVAMDHPDLQDNPKVWWNTSLIEDIVREHVRKWKIDAVSDIFPSFFTC